MGLLVALPATSVMDLVEVRTPCDMDLVEVRTPCFRFCLCLVAIENRTAAEEDGVQAGRQVRGRTSDAAPCSSIIKSGRMRLSTGHIFLSTRLCAPTTKADSLPRMSSMLPSAPGS